MAPHTEEQDYYTPEMLNEIWSPDWFDSMFRNGSWCSGVDPVHRIPPTWQSYHPYACHACKRGPLTNTKLLTCTSCRIVKYCSREHQIDDWKYHKFWCKGYAQVSQVLDTSSYASRAEWSQAWPSLAGLLKSKLDLKKHTSDIQVAIMQPRCRKCFKAGTVPGITLMPCPRCTGVALCSECLSGVDEKEATLHRTFHFDASDPTSECDGHLLSLCCAGMIVEQGNPLGLPSRSDRKKYWNPRDWREYFARKRSDFELPAAMFDMAPVPAFLSDAHSVMLTVQHILALPQLQIDAPKLTKMVIHICGAALNEVVMAGRYVEMIRLNPALVELSLHLIGPGMDNSKDIYRQPLAMERIRASCKLSMENHQGLYHEIVAEFKDDELPTIVICPHSGMHDKSYTSTWRPTIEMLASKGVPFILTGYNHNEVLEDAALLSAWGANIFVPPTANPFRGLRPFLDPGRDPDDLIYSNASFVVAKGTTR